MFKLEDVAWDLGCPGHGKEPWDGLAGMLKSWLRRSALDMVDIDEVDRSPEDCHNRLKEHFDTDRWRKNHEDQPIKKIVMHWAAEGDIERPSSYEKNGGKIELSTRNHEVAPRHHEKLLVPGRWLRGGCDAPPFVLVRLVPELQDHQRQLDHRRGNDADGRDEVPNCWVYEGPLRTSLFEFDGHRRRDSNSELSLRQSGRDGAWTRRRAEVHEDQGEQESVVFACATPGYS
mmetsp:Transcript_18231/g.58801  ORF Transcript_18231/g.58801 Transcript_18231/m.58801 type:complete len:231 (-) Transcript_18231:405-1097(-)